MKWKFKNIPPTKSPSIEVGMPVPLEISNSHQSIRNRHPQSRIIFNTLQRTSFFGTGFSR